MLALLKIYQTVFLKEIRYYYFTGLQTTVPTGLVTDP